MRTTKYALKKEPKQIKVKIVAPYGDTSPCWLEFPSGHRLGIFNNIREARENAAICGWEVVEK